MKFLLILPALGLLGPLLLSSPEAPAAEPDRATSSPSRATWAVDPVHSSIVFRTRHNGVVSFYGCFKSVSGEVVHDPEDPTTSSILVVIDAASVDTRSENRDEHLRSPDFFSAKEFPEIAFESTEVSANGDALEVKGELTFHGVTKEVLATARATGTGEARGTKLAGFEGSLTIDMRDFGISFVEQRPGALGPEVELLIALECKAE